MAMGTFDKGAAVYLKQAKEEFLRIGTTAEPIRFVETGTLRDCPRRPLRLPIKYEATTRARLDSLNGWFPYLEKRARAHRRRMWRKWAFWFTLFVTMTAMMR
jgi:hypothetical protein